MTTREYNLDRRPFGTVQIVLGIILYVCSIQWRWNEGNSWIRLLLGLIIIATLVGSYSVLQLSNPPKNCVYNFLNKKGEFATGNTNGSIKSNTLSTLVCLGDSITQGRASADWVSCISHEFYQRLKLHGKTKWVSNLQVVNNGQNNITTYTIAQERVDWTLACAPDCVILLIGSNDIRCPINPVWHWIECIIWNIPNAITLETMEANYRDILKQLLERSSHCKIAVCTIPPVGEKLDTRVNNLVSQYNRMVSKIVEELKGADYGERVALIDLYSALISKINNNGKEKLRSPSKPEMLALHASWQALLHYTLGLPWKTLSEWVGNVVLSDGIHLNENGGKILCDLVVDWLLELDLQSEIGECKR